MRFAAAILGVIMIASSASSSEVTKKPFGKLADGTQVDLYTLTDGRVEVGIMTYGGVIVTIKTPDRNGKVADITLGFDDLAGYVGAANKTYFGAIIGRYANRLAHGAFKLDGKSYQVPKNDGENSLHGGTKGFNSYVWQAKQISNGVELTHVSPAGDMGFPGKLTATVRYTLNNSGLQIEYSATTDAPTVLNLTNHAYFNLAGQASGDVLKHQLTLHAARYTPVDGGLIPTGELAPVAGTPFDFQAPHAIGERIGQSNEQLKLGRGYDHNFVLENGGKVGLAATMTEPTSGRVLEVFTDQPGIQFYSGNFLDGGLKGKGGFAYQKRGGFCLETQHFPDSPNHANFPSTELKPGETFHSVTIYRFSAK